MMHFRALWTARQIGDPGKRVEAASANGL